MSFLAEYLITKAELQATRWEEVARHNKKMEELEEQKVKNEEQKTKSKEAELAYKIKSMKTKVELEADGFSKKAILLMFLDLSPMYDTNSSS